MRKNFILLGTAILTLGLASAVYADDVIVRTSVGSGEVVFKETAEKAEITEEELTNEVKEYFQNMDSASMFADANIEANLEFSEDFQLPVKAGIIGDMKKVGTDSHVKFHYDYDFMGSVSDGVYESYMWEEDGKKYSAVYSETDDADDVDDTDDDDDWIVTESDMVSETIDKFGDSLNNFTLRGLMPNLYEEEGNKYYVCIYNKDELMEELQEFEQFKEYSSMVESVLGDNNFCCIVVINAEDFSPRGITFTTDKISGTLPGAIFGSDTDMNYSCNDLYATVLFDKDVETIVVPDEVLNTPVQDLNFDFSSGDGLEDSDDLDDSIDDFDFSTSEGDEFELDLGDMD